MAEEKPEQGGYEIGRDEHGLTERERKVRDLIVDRKSLGQIGVALDITRQRVAQIRNNLRDKGVIEMRGGQWFLVETKEKADG